MTDQVPAIEIRNLVRRYGRTDAVDGLSLRVAPGRCYGFFGRNGAGGGGGLHLINELQVDGLGRLEIELEQHGHLSYDAMTVLSAREANLFRAGYFCGAARRLSGLRGTLQRR